jgi:hypothetical protein
VPGLDEGAGWSGEAWHEHRHKCRLNPRHSRRGGGMGRSAAHMNVFTCQTRSSTNVLCDDRLSKRGSHTLGHDAPERIRWPARGYGLCRQRWLDAE